MFVKKSYVDEIASSLEDNMSILANQPEQHTKERREKVITCLTIASEMLDQAGLEKEAIAVMNVLKRFANDPAIPQSSEKALKNLEEKGWMFNADDKDKKDEEAPNAEELSELFDKL